MYKKILLSLVVVVFLGLGCGPDMQSVIDDQQRQINDLSVQLDRANAEDPMVKVERCKAEAGNLSKDAIDFIKKDSEDDLGRKSFENALASCYRNNLPLSMQEACGESTSKRFNKLREEEQVRLYNRYYSECLSSQ